MARAAPAVMALLVVNLALFGAGLLVPAWRDWLVAEAAFWFPRNDHFAAWQVVTHMFLHGSVAHVFFNMFALGSFGIHLERRWGSGHFLLFYFLCGIGAGLIHTAVQWYEFNELYDRLRAAGMSEAALAAILSTGRGVLPPDPALQSALVDLYRIQSAPMLGASGAIYGVLVAFGLLYPNAKLALLFLPVPIAAKIFIPILLLLDLFSGITGFSLFGGGIAHFAHLGGALIGFLLMLLWRHRQKRPPPIDLPTPVQT